MHEIFLSYDHDDRNRIAPLAIALEREGWTVWWDHRILPGQAWDEVIQDALNKADCVVVVWSKHSVKSEWVRIEANSGRERRILVPVLLDQVNIPLAFQLVQAAPLIGWDGDTGHNGFQALAAGIRAVINWARVPAQPSPPPALDVTEPRALDAAVADELPVREPAHLIAMIRRSESTGLKAILASDKEYDLSPEDVVSRPFDLTFPADAAGRPLPALVTLHIHGPEFEPSSQQKKVRVSLGRDSAVFDFLLTPVVTGELIIQVEVYEGDVCLASRVLKPRGVAGEPVSEGRLVVSMPLNVSVKSEAEASAERSAPSPAQGPGEFTRVFQTAASASTPGGFTRIFQASAPTESTLRMPTVTPAQPPASPPAPSATPDLHADSPHPPSAAAGELSAYGRLVDPPAQAPFASQLPAKPPDHGTAMGSAKPTDDYSMLFGGKSPQLPPAPNSSQPFGATGTFSPPAPGASAPGTGRSEYTQLLGPPAPPPLAAPLSSPPIRSPLPERAPKPSRTLWMKLGITATMIFVFGPVIWYSMIPKAAPRDSAKAPLAQVLVKVRVEVQPPNAALVIGRIECAGPCNLELAAGPVEVKASAPGYDSITKEAILPATAEPVVLTINLKKGSVIVK